MCFDIWPKTHSTIGQQSTVSQTRCLFLFYFFSLHDYATPYPIELDELIYNWHVVNPWTANCSCSRAQKMGQPVLTAAIVVLVHVVF